MLLVVVVVTWRMRDGGGKGVELMLLYDDADSGDGDDDGNGGGGDRGLARGVVVLVGGIARATDTVHMHSFTSSLPLFPSYTPPPPPR